MRATVTVVTASTGAREEAVIDAPGATPSGEVVAELGRLIGASPSDAATIDGVPIDPMTPLAQASWRDGAVVGFGLRSPDPDDSRRGYLELRVVGGPAAGGVHPVALGSVTIGRGAGSDVVLDDLDVSRRHAVVTVGPDGVSIADLTSTNGTLVDGHPVGGRSVPVRPGAQIRIGESTLEIAVPDNPPVALAPIGDGRRAFNRPPRLDAPDPNREPPTVEFPTPPARRARPRLPVIAIVAPLLAGVALAAVMRRPEYLLFTALSPLMMGGQWLADRVGNRRAERSEQAAYDGALATARALLVEQLKTEEAGRRKSAPDPATVSAIATAPSARLWERRPGDADFLCVRLGTGSLPAGVRVSGADIEPPLLDDVPVTVPLASAGVLGISGPADRVGALARALLGQLVTLHSPRELGVVVVTEPTHAEAWEWVRWLPHVQPGPTSNCQALVGIDRPTVAARISELTALLNTRRSQHGRPESARTIVVVVDGAYALRDTPGFADLLTNGPELGVFAICLDTASARLPNECAAVATLGDTVATRMRLCSDSAPQIDDVIADGVSIAWAERVARGLAPLREHTAGSESEALPDAVRWLEIAALQGGTEGADAITDELVEQWQRTIGGRTTAVLGASSDGPFRIDIARDGPHALIAGTTGSGKSELLQTLVASLAVGNRPDELCFVLVDYKGGAAFGSCSSLPHTVGFVTDLDGGLAERALVSLTAELKRRETLLAHEGVADIDAYRNTGQRLARLVIVVDEFASLAEELPDFVGGLVGIAQRGRSLGVHLILATQRPEGVVSADIRANTNLRICLGVMRDSESRDVIDVPDAAWISRATPGRAFARTGHGEVHAFQTGRVGGQARPAAQGVTVRLAPFRALAQPEPSRPEATTNAGTDLDLIVDACRVAAVRLDVATPPSPWLAPLPEIVVAAPNGDAPLRVTVGVRDLPARQSREPYVVDLSTFGHLVIAGSARTGRTTALRTIAGAFARVTSVADLHLYAFDGTGGSLAGVGSLPHCGAVISNHEPQRARRLISMLTAELTRRQTILATQGFSGVAEQRRLGTDPLPHVALLIDGWEAFNTAFDEVDSGAVIDGVFRVLREGAAAGLHVFITADRGGLVGRLTSTVENRLVLRLADRGDFALIGLPARSVPQNLPAGRCFLAHDLVETQLCLLGADASGPAQLTELAAIAATAAERDADVPAPRRPRRVDELPSRVALGDLTRRAPMQHTGEVVLGVGGDELDAVRIDLLESGPGFVVAGPPRSGRSTALATIAIGLRAAGWHTVAVTARPSPLGAFVDTAVDASAPSVETALTSATQRVAVLVDDAELVTDSPAAAVLDRFTRQARDAGNLVAIAGTTDDLSIGFRGFVVEARRSRTGVLLTPRGPLDGEALGIRLPRDTGGQLPPGRGLLVTRGEATAVHLAVPA